jgi:dinuclear metal center YbgI/SA1388 family protein
LLWELIRAGVSIYSAHTAYDSADKGINQSLAQRLGLAAIQPLNPIADDPGQLGSGRCGSFHPAMKLDAVVEKIKHEFRLSHIQVVGEMDRAIARAAVACGSGGSFLEAAHSTGCDVLITGEASFHTCVEASATRIALILMGHFSSERFSIEILADKLRLEFKDAEVWASEQEVDPIRLV